MEKDTKILLFGLGALLGMGLLFWKLLSTLKYQVIIRDVESKTGQPQILVEGMPEIIKTEEIRPTTAHIINHHLNNANTWYEIKLPTDAITWQLKTRGNYDLSYSYSPMHQTYMTLTAGDVLSADTSPNKNINAIYVMCDTAGVISELEVWRR